jgi:hypothetical protein
MPSNAQIDETLQYVIDHSPVDKFKLSPEGQKLIQDARDIIKTARVIVAEKNADELFQNFVWHTRDIDTNDVLPVDKEKQRTMASKVSYLRIQLLFNLTLPQPFTISAPSFPSSSPTQKFASFSPTSPS